MRLIDADALLEKMKRTSRYFDLKFDIEEMPTAYSVEKVVAELEKKDDDCGCGKITVWDALYIVRKGGVE